jgi:threonine/homoserine/homoserine lactone efflux protein
VSLDALLIAYLTFTFILAVTPGSTTAVVVRNTLEGGRGAGFAAAVGAALANTTQASAAALGLAVVIARFPTALVVLRVLGGGYLAWLGGSSIWRVARQRGVGVRAVAATDDRVSIDAKRTSFRQGVTVNLLNPAISTFYLVVVPSFLPAGAPWWYYAVFASMHVGIAFTCHMAWALAFDRLRRFFQAPGARRILELATGVVLLGLAARVLFRT